MENGKEERLTEKNYSVDWMVKEKCDCEKTTWASGYINIGSAFGQDLGKMHVNKCVACGMAQLMERKKIN